MKTLSILSLCCAFVLAATLTTTAQQRSLRIVGGHTPEEHSPKEEYSEKEKKERDNPAARAAWEFERTRDPRTGALPASIRAREYAFASSLPVRYTSDKGASAQSLVWQPMGPSNVGGRTRAVAFDVRGTGVVFAGAVTGGLWRSTDKGESWTRVTPPNEMQGVSCVVQDKRAGHSNVWYYGTGEPLGTSERRLDTLRRTVATGHGIYKSTDNGATWSFLPSTEVSSAGTLQEHFQGVWNIAVDNSNAAEEEIYAACYGGVLRSADGGTSWQLVLGGIDQPAFNTDIALTSAGVAYAAVGSQSTKQPSSGQGMWRSVDGVNWVDITPPGFPKQVRRTVIAVAPSDESVVYVFTETPFANAGPYEFASSTHSLWRYKYKSGSGAGSGGEWTDLSQSIPGGPLSTDPAVGLNTLGGYCMVLAVHPAAPEVVYIGGTDLFCTTNGFAKAEDVRKIGGYPASWSPFDLHPDLHAIAFDPSSPDVMCVGGDGGITWSNNNRALPVQWRVQNNGYVSSQFYAVAQERTTPGDQLIVGGLQDNGSFATMSANPDAAWELMTGGDGTSCAVANNQKALYLSAQAGYLVQLKYDEEMGAYQYGGLWRPIETGDNNYNFITLFVLEPNNTNMMYLASKNNLWRHDNLAETPEAIGVFDPNWTAMGPIVDPPVSIMAFGISTQPAHRLYVGTNDGAVFRIDDAHSSSFTVTKVTADAFPDGAVVSSISVDPDDADKVLVSFSNYNVPSLFYSADAGNTWSDVSGNLEEFAGGGGAGPSVRCVHVYRTESATVYLAGTSVGLYSTSLLAGSSTVWQQEGATTIGKSIVEAIDSRRSDGRIIVGTQGNGVFAGNLAPVSVGSPRVISAVLLEQNYPNPVGATTRVRFHLPAAAAVELVLYNTAGQRVHTLLNRDMPAGEHAVDIATDELAAGAYFYRLEVGDAVQTRMMTVIK